MKRKIYPIFILFTAMFCGNTLNDNASENKIIEEFRTLDNQLNIAAKKAIVSIDDYIGIITEKNYGKDRAETMSENLKDMRKSVEAIQIQVAIFLSMTSILVENEKTLNEIRAGTEVTIKQLETLEANCRRNFMKERTKINNRKN